MKDQDIVAWPRGPFWWSVGRTLYASVPFTWNLREVKHKAMVGSLAHDRMLVGGPAVDLMPSYFYGVPNCEVGHEMPGIMQKINPQATRTTTGCVRKCSFCGVGKGRIEAGGLRELADWPDLPVICDNNLLAASRPHFKRVIDRLVRHGWADFEQGLDSRLLTDYHAGQIARIKRPMIRLALDSSSIAAEAAWIKAFDSLRRAGIAKASIRSYALIGLNSGPEEAWARCRWIENHGIKVLPMWFHALDALEHNIVEDWQEKLGWSDYERRRIMQWFYQHKEAVPGRATYG